MPTSSSPATSLARQPHARAVGWPQRPQGLDRIPWLWHEAVVMRVPVPPWAMSLAIFLFFYGTSLLAASWAGDVAAFLKDPSWIVLYTLPAAASLLTSHAPRAILGMWDHARPWLSNPEAEIARAVQATPPMLMRLFWPSYVSWTLLNMQAWAAGIGPIPHPPWTEPYPHPEAFRYYAMLMAPTASYFMAGATSIGLLGLTLVARQFCGTWKLKQGFVLGGGKAALRPFNQLVWLTWAAVSLPFLLVLLVQATISGWREAPALAALDYTISCLLFVTVLFTAVIRPQGHMSRLLASEKSRELRALDAEMQELAAVPPGADVVEALRRMQRYNHLAFQCQRIMAFVPTLIDSRFVLQIGMSTTAIILANLLLRYIIIR